MPSVIKIMTRTELYALRDKEDNMTLHELWENVNIDQHLVYEELNDDDTVSIKEYEGDDRCRKGADEVYGISADYLAGIGYVIVAHML